MDSETKLKHFRKYADNIDYKVCIQQLDAIYKEKTKGIKNRSKFNWYELGEKPTNFFLYLVKYRAIQSQIYFVIINQGEIADQAEINNQIFPFYQSFFFFRVKFRIKQTK